jgi:hypothetical protein
MFPTSINGQIELKALKSEHVEMVTRGIKRQLETMKAVDISQRNCIVSFRGGFFPFRFVANLSVLDPVSRGEIEVLSGTPSLVKYRLSDRSIPSVNHCTNPNGKIEVGDRGLGYAGVLVSTSKCHGPKDNVVI